MGYTISGLLEVTRYNPAPARNLNRFLGGAEMITYLRMPHDDPEKELPESMRLRNITRIRCRDDTTFETPFSERYRPHNVCPDRDKGFEGLLHEIITTLSSGNSLPLEGVVKLFRNGRRETICKSLQLASLGPSITIG